MKFARVISLLLSVLLVLGLCVSCTSSCDSTGSSEISGGSSSNPSEWLGDDDKDESNGDFDDNGDEDDNTIPGDNSDSDDSDNNDDNDDYDDSDDSDDSSSSGESLFADKDSMEYYYETDYYAYGITDTGSEILAMIDDDGEYFDTYSGAGQVHLRGMSGSQLFSSGRVIEYARSLQNGSLAVTVTYDYMDYFASSDNTIITSTYIFYDEYVDITYRMVFTANEDISQGKSYIGRSVGNEYESIEKSFTSKWNFPTDNDAPYRTTESYVTKMIFDDEHVVYTFNYGNVATKTGIQTNPHGRFKGVYFDQYYPDVNVPLLIGYLDNDEDGPQPSKSIDFEAKYAIVFAKGEDHNVDRYRGYFMSAGSSFAAGISPITKNDDNTTLFVKDKVDFNLNITNLYDDELSVDVRYDIRDYYGNIIESGIYLDSTVFGLQDANRKITIDAKKTGYGMYFITMKVFTKRYTFYDYMPVILMPDADYPYRSSFPFGIAQYQDMLNRYDQMNMLLKIGAGYIRNVPLTVDNAEDIASRTKIITTLQQSGMFILGPTASWAGVGSAEGDKRFNTYGKYYKYFCMGNEVNMQINSLTSPSQAFINSVWDEYYKDTYLVQKRYCQKYGWTLVTAGVSAGMRNWIDKYEEAGLWNNSDVISNHVYSYNYLSPDNPKNLGMWSVEGGLMRMKSAIDDFARKYNGFRKRWFLNECGYSSINSDNYVDPRTKGDYDIRCLILGAAYGAEYAETYSIFDFSNGGFGCYQNDMEWGFGAFYVPDYYSRVLPKPTAICFSTFARCIRGYKSCVESSVYSNGVHQDQNGGGKLRVFDINTSVDGHVFVAWSNIDPQDCDVLSAGIPVDPHLPWSPDNFTGTEDLVMDAIGSTVKVVSLGGKTTTYTAVGGKVTIPVTGSPVFIFGAK